MKNLMTFLFLAVVSFFSTKATDYYPMYVAGNDGSLLFCDDGNSKPCTINITSSSVTASIYGGSLAYHNTDQHGNRKYVDETHDGYLRWKTEFLVSPDQKHVRVDRYVSGTLVTTSFYASSHSERNQFTAENRHKSSYGNGAAFNGGDSGFSGITTQRSTVSKTTCPKCHGKKWRADSHAYQVNADDYHWPGGSGCPYCGSTSDHWHSHCNYCNADGTINQRRWFLPLAGKLRLVTIFFCLWGGCGEADAAVVCVVVAKKVFLFQILFLTLQSHFNKQHLIT